MLNSANKKYWWGLPALLLILGGFIFLQQQYNQAASNSSQQKIHKIIIAVPDLTASKNNSSGNLVVDHILLNRLFEKQFKAQHIEVEWRFFKGAGPAINEALVNKQADLAFVGDLAAIIGKANGIDTRLLAATGRHFEAYLGVIPHQGYTRLEQLKGKRIAIWQGTAVQLSFDRFLHSQGFSEKDFKIVNLDSSAMNAALAAKQIDAGWGLMSILALQHKGLVDIPFGSQNTPNHAGSVQSGLIARQEFIDQDPQVTQQIVDVLTQATQWVAQPSHREEAITQAVKNAGYPLALYQQYLKDQDLGVLFSPLLDEEYLTYLQSGADVAFSSKLIKKQVDVHAWAEQRFIQSSTQKFAVTGP